MEIGIDPAGGKDQSFEVTVDKLTGELLQAGLKPMHTDDREYPPAVSASGLFQFSNIRIEYDLGNGEIVLELVPDRNMGVAIPSFIGTLSEMHAKKAFRGLLGCLQIQPDLIEMIRDDDAIMNELFPSSTEAANIPEWINLEELGNQLEKHCNDADQYLEEIRSKASWLKTCGHGNGEVNEKE